MPVASPRSRGSPRRRVTGEYDYQLRLSCTGTEEFELVLDKFKRELGVREVRNRLVLHAIPMAEAWILDV
jgi:Lrp/AsnC family transcriptional regulator, leucine-responsive regulatory protein